jgi:hypothetical protein
MGEKTNVVMESVRTSIDHGYPPDTVDVDKPDNNVYELFRAVETMKDRLDKLEHQPRANPRMSKDHLYWSVAVAGACGVVIGRNLRIIACFTFSIGMCAHRRLLRYPGTGRIARCNAATHYYAADVRTLVVLAGAVFSALCCVMLITAACMGLWLR